MMFVHLAFFVLAPALARLTARRWRAARVLGPVVLCYLLGIMWGNQPWLPVPSALAEQVAGAGVVLAIALMLLALDVRAWRHLARGTAVAALLAFASSMIASGLGAWLFRGSVSESWQVAGMLGGLYTGGTVNMAAVATALEVPHARFLALSAADVTLGGAYYFFLLIAGARVFGRVLGFPARASGTPGPDTPVPAPAASSRVRDVVAALTAGVAIIAAAFAVSQLVPEGARDAVLVCLVSTLAIVISLQPRVRRMPAVYPTGEYMLLVFCVAVGSLARPHALADADPMLLAYMAAVMFGAIAMHTVACRLLRIDRDTCIIASSAAIYGPPFVPAIAVRLDNRDLIISGVTIGVAGIALGNYIGLAVAFCMRWLGA